MDVSKYLIISELVLEAGVEPARPLLAKGFSSSVVLLGLCLNHIIYDLGCWCIVSTHLSIFNIELSSALFVFIRLQPSPN